MTPYRMRLMILTSHVTHCSPPPPSLMPNQNVSFTAIEIVLNLELACRYSFMQNSLNTVSLLLGASTAD